jgi:hypothetical protein
MSTITPFLLWWLALLGFGPAQICQIAHTDDPACVASTDDGSEDEGHSLFGLSLRRGSTNISNGF